MKANLRNSIQQDSEVTVTWKSWAVWGIAAFFYGYEFLLRASPSVMQSEISQSLSLDAAGLGFIVSLYYWAYSTMQVPAGICIDRYGSRLVLTIAAIICTVGSVLMGAATEPILAGVARFMIGFGSAFALLGTFKLAGNWFPSTRFGLLAGSALMFGTAGATLAQGPLSYLVDSVGWRVTLYILGAVGLINAILLWVAVHDHPEANRKIKKTRAEKKAARAELDAWESFKQVIFNRQSWYIGCFAAFIYIPIACFGELWGVPYIMKCCFCDRPNAAAITSIIFIGITVGAPLFGWLSDFWQRRKAPLLLGSSIVFVVTLAILCFDSIPPLIMSVLMFILGVALGSHMILFALIRENNPPNASAVAAGFGNFICMLVPGFFQYLIGLSLDFLNQEITVVDHMSYSLESYQISLLTIPIGVVLAIIFLLLSRETYAKQANTGNG